MAITIKLDRDTKETEFVSLPNPPEELSESQDQAEEIEARFIRRAIELPEQKKKKLASKLCQEIQEWKDSRSKLQQKLREWNDLAEGIEKPTDFPWVGASSVHIPLPKIKLREIKSTITRNTMRPVPFLMCKYSGAEDQLSTYQSTTKQIEDFMEDALRNKTNIHSTLKEALLPIGRDGTTPVQIMWETEIERVTDYKMYESVEDFLSDYPDADSAGISSKKFRDIVAKLHNGSTYEVQYEYDLVTYDAPKAYIVPLVDFFHWPVFESDISNTETHGKRIWYKDYDIERLHSIGKFDNKDDVTKILKMAGDIRDDESITVSRDNIEGIDRSTDTKGSREFECYELCHKEDLDGDGVKEKYLVTIHFKSSTILRIEKYPIRKGQSSYFPLRFMKRDGRLLGFSLCEDLSGVSNEIDIIHRQRINSRTITHVPSFKAKTGTKGLFDPSDKRLQFRPGVTFYLDDPDGDVKQFDIRPVDLSGSMDEENMLIQFAELIVGASSGLSGQSNPLDPRAPARKQQELLRQSANRIDDYVDPLLDQFAKIGQYVLDLYYQYGPDRIAYSVKSKDGSFITKEMKRTKLFSPNVLFQVHGTSVFMNPELEFSRAVEIDQILAQNPTTAQNPIVRMESLRRVLDAGRVADVDKLIPDEEFMKNITRKGPGGDIIPSEQETEASVDALSQERKIKTREKEQKDRREHEKLLALLDSTKGEGDILNAA